MASFAYRGHREETTVFGLLFPHGVPVEVVDEQAIRKLSRNPNFTQVFDGVEVLMPDQPKRRGRPPKAKP